MTLNSSARPHSVDEVSRQMFALKRICLEEAMSSISIVGNSDADLEHMIVRVAMPATSRVPDRSSGDRAPQTPEKPRRHGKGTANLPHRKSGAREEEHGDEDPPILESPALEEVELYSPSRKTGASYSKDQAQHNVDIRA